jgi:Uma2 family endonuclease
MPSPVSSGPQRQRPAVDERLVAPETRYEVDDGRVVYVAPADEPHGSRHSKISALLEAHVRGEYDAASDMLTRTSVLDDIAPDASVFPQERDPDTGGRRIEELAFEVVSTERLSEAAVKARKLVERGVRRVFAVDVARQRAFEWSRDLGTWQILAADSTIDDAVLAVKLPVTALVSAAKVDDAMAQALLAKGNPVLEAALDRAHARATVEAKAEAVLSVLAARGLDPTPSERTRVTSEGDVGVLELWLRRAARCSRVSELFEA